MTQKQLADALFVSHKTISSWEKGRTEPGVEDLKKLALVFQTDIDCLVSSQEDMPDRFYAHDLKNKAVAMEESLFHITKTILCSNERSVRAIKEAMALARKRLSDLSDSQDFLPWFIDLLLPICNHILQEATSADDIEDRNNPTFYHMPQQFHDAIVHQQTFSEKKAQILSMMVLLFCLAFCMYLLNAHNTGLVPETKNSSSTVQSSEFVFNRSIESEKKEMMNSMNETRAVTYDVLPAAIKSVLSNLPEQYHPLTESFHLWTNDKNTAFQLLRKGYCSNETEAVIAISIQTETEAAIADLERFVASEISEDLWVYFFENEEKADAYSAIYSEGGMIVMIEGENIGKGAFCELIYTIY